MFHPIYTLSIVNLRCKMRLIQASRSLRQIRKWIKYILWLRRGAVFILLDDFPIFAPRLLPLNQWRSLRISCGKYWYRFVMGHAAKTLERTLQRYACTIRHEDMKNSLVSFFCNLFIHQGTTGTTHGKSLFTVGVRAAVEGCFLSFTRSLLFSSSLLTPYVQ